MARFEHLVFVCNNRRDAADARGCCAGRGSAEVLDRLKELTHRHQLKGRVRVTTSGCLDNCSKGCTVVVFSADPARRETWYSHVTLADAEALFTAHVLEGRRLDRLVERCD